MTDREEIYAQMAEGFRIRMNDREEIEFWKRRASRLRHALLDIASGHEPDPKAAAANAINFECDARETGK